MRKFFQAATFTLFLHSFAGWFYIAENAVFHPETLSWGLTHFAPWPREDTFGIICFGVSIASLFTYMMIRDVRSPISKSNIAVSSASKKSIAKAKENPRVLKLNTREAKINPKNLKVSANKAKSKPRPLKTNAKKAGIRRMVKKIKVIDLSEQ